MSIYVNDELQEIAANLNALLERLGMHDMVVVTALNGRFVPKSERGATALADGDRIEVLSPMQGG